MCLLATVENPTSAQGCIAATRGATHAWLPIQPEVVVAPGTWPAPKPFLSGFLMLTSGRSVFLRYSTTASVTSRTAVYGPVCTVVWQGSAGDCRPYADLTGYRNVQRKLPKPDLCESLVYGVGRTSIPLRRTLGRAAGIALCRCLAVEQMASHLAEASRPNGQWCRQNCRHRIRCEAKGCVVTGDLRRLDSCPGHHTNPL